MNLRIIRAHARTGDPETSFLAAASVKVRQSQLAVLTLLVEGPATDEELAERAGRNFVVMSPSGLRSRRSELVTLGLVEFTGHFRLTQGGRHARVWQRA